MSTCSRLTSEADPAARARFGRMSVWPGGCHGRNGIPTQHGSAGVPPQELRGNGPGKESAVVEQVAARMLSHRSGSLRLEQTAVRTQVDARWQRAGRLGNGYFGVSDA